MTNPISQAAVELLNRSGWKRKKKYRGWCHPMTKTRVYIIVGRHPILIGKSRWASVGVNLKELEQWIAAETAPRIDT